MRSVGLENLVQLDQDHPGFRDPTYRARRDTIARIALSFSEGDPVPDAPYSDAEHGVWAQICASLAPLHSERVATGLMACAARLDLPTDRIPQLAHVNRRLGERFAMAPVAGLVQPQVFLRALGRGVFLSTQYIRHHSRPLYTPEPDVVHELVGHAASLLHPGVAALSRRFGQAAQRAQTDAEIERLTRLYWHTLEFGLVQEDGRLKAYGAGLLSSIGELTRATDGVPELAEWDLERIEATPYDPTTYQPVVFVAPSLQRALSDVSDWLG
jgi:phenylalanine-4-hydroxylase